MGSARETGGALAAGDEEDGEFAGPDGVRAGPFAFTLPTGTPRFHCGVRYAGGHSSAFVHVLCGEREEFVAPSPNRTPEAAVAEG